MELLRPYLAEVPSSLERRSTADRSHAAVYTALVEGSSERARREMLDHLNLAYDSLLGELRQLPRVPHRRAWRMRKRLLKNTRAWLCRVPRLCQCRDQGQLGTAQAAGQRIALAWMLRQAALLPACIALAVAAGWCTASRAEPAGDGIELFERKIRPVLEQRCVSCHGSLKHKAGLRLDYRDGILHGGESGPAIVPGKPDESVLIQALRHETVEMPPDGKLTDGIIDDFVEWVRRGADRAIARLQRKFGRRLARRPGGAAQVVELAAGSGAAAAQRPQRIVVS